MIVCACLPAQVLHKAPDGVTLSVPGPAAGLWPKEAYMRLSEREREILRRRRQMPGAACHDKINCPCCQYWYNFGELLLGGRNMAQDNYTMALVSCPTHPLNLCACCAELR